MHSTPVPSTALCNARERRYSLLVTRTIQPLLKIVASKRNKKLTCSHIKTEYCAYCTIWDTCTPCIKCKNFVSNNLKNTSSQLGKTKGKVNNASRNNGSCIKRSISSFLTSLYKFCIHISTLVFWLKKKKKNNRQTNRELISLKTATTVLQHYLINLARCWKSCSITKTGWGERGGKGGGVGLGRKGNILHPFVTKGCTGWTL